MYCALFKTSISIRITSGQVSLIRDQAELSNLVLILKIYLYHYKFLLCPFFRISGTVVNNYGMVHVLLSEYEAYSEWVY